MITAELWGGPHDGQTVALEGLIPSIIRLPIVSGLTVNSFQPKLLEPDPDFGYEVYDRIDGKAMDKCVRYIYHPIEFRRHLGMIE